MGLVETPFKLTSEEILCSAAITVILNALSKEGTSNNTIEQICFTPQYGFTASASSIPCGPHLVRITDIKEGNIDWSTVPYCECEDAENYQLYTNDILMARAGSIGKSFIVSDISTEAVFASYMIRLRAKSNFNSKYIYWCLQSQQFWAQIMEAQRGSAMKNINAKMISALTFPMPSLDIQSSIVAFLDSFQIHLKYPQKALPLLPHPLEKQRRIVARIEELAAKIEEARGLRREAVEEAEELWISSLEATFNMLSDKHQNKLFRDFCDVVRGGSPRPAGDPTYYDGLIPFLKVADLTNHSGKFVTTYNATIKEAGLSHSRYVNAGTLLLTNSGATLGVPKICTFGTCFNDGIQAFLNIPEEISIEYLYYFFVLKTRWFREWVARGQGQPNLNTEMVKTMSIPIPTLTEQKSIVAYLDKTYNQVIGLKQQQTTTTAELNALLPSILDKAFKGEL
jgi:type I restriction enzyme, S subunit